MAALELTFDDGRILGSGIDLVGTFTLRGGLEDGQVALLKHYLGRHTVDYLGEYDGEGLMCGQWRIGFFSGPWLIRINGLAETARTEPAEIIDIV